MRHLLFTWLCVWSFSVLPTYAAWVGSGPVVAIHDTAPVSDDGCGGSEEACCPLCTSDGGCCTSTAPASDSPAPCCPLPADGEAPGCPCSQTSASAGALFVFVPACADAPTLASRPSLVPEWSDRAASRTLRIPDPPPRFAV